MSPLNPDPVYRVFTDGSATTRSTRTGAWCAVVLCPDGERTRVCGCAAPTTIGRTELLALVNALQFITGRERKNIDPYRVEVRSDSQYLVGCVQGRNERRKNVDLWRQYEALEAGVNLAIGWTARNTLPEQAECDRVCDALRRGLEQFLEPEPTIT